MARTAPMRLVELMVLKEDIDTVIEFLGKNGNFQFQQKFDTSNSAQNPPAEIFAKHPQSLISDWKYKHTGDILSFRLLIHLHQLKAARYDRYRS